ncbi:MAG: hypothetical protein RPV21_15510 [Candidatus Sedimenticola sp. (ex Thyasira tokunagai)]
MMRRSGLFLISVFLLALGLVGCSTTQEYSSAKQQVIDLNEGDLSRNGLAFLTPTTVTGKEEDKQVFALVFTDTLAEMRPDIPLLTLPQTLSAINQAGLAGSYRQMVVNYRDTGIFDKTTLSKISETVGVRYVAQLKLSDFLQYSKGRFSALGIRLLETKQAHVRVFLQIWDVSNGTIAWEAVEELNFAYETGSEDPVSFNLIVRKAAVNLIGRLP